MKSYSPSLLVVPLLLGTLLFRGARAFSNGQVGLACDSMVPQHGTSPQTTPPPYSVTASPNGDGTYTVTVQSTGGQEFEGFLLQARDSSDSRVGTFTSPGTEGQLLSCGYDGGAVSHRNDDERTSASAIWNPGSFSGNMQFRATVVEDFSVYWVQIPSETITVGQQTISTQPGPLPPAVSSGQPCNNNQPGTNTFSGAYLPPSNPCIPTQPNPNYGPPINPQPGIPPNPQPGYLPPTNPQPGFPTNPQPGFPTNPQPGFPTNPQPGFPTNPQPGIPTNPQPGYLPPTNPQPGFPTNPQTNYGPPTNPQPGFPTNPQPNYGPSTNPQPGFPTNPQPGFPTNPQPGFPTNPQPNYGPPPSQPFPGTPNIPRPTPINPNPGYLPPPPGYLPPPRG